MKWWADIELLEAALYDALQGQAVAAAYHIADVSYGNLILARSAAELLAELCADEIFDRRMEEDSEEARYQEDKEAEGR